jgi:hypothetical protein
LIPDRIIAVDGIVDLFETHAKKPASGLPECSHAIGIELVGNLLSKNQRNVWPEKSVLR